MGKRKTNQNKTRQINFSDLNIISSNVRGVSNKKKSIETILDENDVDICILSELNTKNLPVFKGYTPFTKYSDKPFHGVAILIRNEIAKHALKIPDVSELEAVHVRISNTIPALNILGTYIPPCRG